MAEQTKTPARERTGNGVHRKFEEPLQPTEDFMTYLRQYAREKPDVVALWCFGVGFVVGWKLKPW